MAGVIFFFFQAEDGIRDYKVTGVQTCALPISSVAGLDPLRGRRDPCPVARIRGLVPRPVLRGPEPAPRGPGARSPDAGGTCAPARARLSRLPSPSEPRQRPRRGGDARPRAALSPLT